MRMYGRLLYFAAILTFSAVNHRDRQKNSTKLCNIFGHGPDLKMNCLNVVVSSPYKGCGRMMLRRHRDLSANISGKKNKQQTTNRNYYKIFPHISSESRELWPTRSSGLRLHFDPQSRSLLTGSHRPVVTKRESTKLCHMF